MPTKEVHVQRMLNFGQFDFGQFDFGEVEIGQSRNWPKAKLAEQMVFALYLRFLFLFLFFFSFALSFSFTSSLSSSSSSSSVSLFVPKNVNPEPRTLHPKPSDPPPQDPPPLDPPLRWTTLRWTTLRRTAQNFAFFSLLPPQFSFFSPSLGVLPLNFGGVFEFRDPEMCTFGLSGCHVETPAEKKSAKFWASTLRGLHPSVPPPFGAPPFVMVPKVNIQKLAEVEIGRSRNWPKSITFHVKLQRAIQQSSTRGSAGMVEPHLQLGFPLQLKTVEVSLSQCFDRANTWPEEAETGADQPENQKRTPHFLCAPCRHVWSVSIWWPLRPACPRVRLFSVKFQHRHFGPHEEKKSTIRSLDILGTLTTGSTWLGWEFGRHERRQHQAQEDRFVFSVGHSAQNDVSGAR